MTRNRMYMQRFYSIVCTKFYFRMNFFGVILVFGVLNSVFSQEAPVITHMTANLTKNVNESVALECRAENAKNYPIVWSKINRNLETYLPISNNAHLIVKDSRFNVKIYILSYILSSSIFEINKITEEDRGTYQCSVLISANETVSKEVELQVREPCKSPIPRIVAISESQLKNTGDTIEVNCSVKCEGDSSVLWLKSDKVKRNFLPIASLERRIIRDNRFNVRSSNASDPNSKIYTLEIRDARLEDAGYYRCLVLHHLNEQVTEEVEVTVRMPPIFSDNTTRSVTVQAYYPLRIQCYAHGYPEPRIKISCENHRWLIEKENGHVAEVEETGKYDGELCQCTADNGVVVKRDIKVNIEFGTKLFDAKNKLNYGRRLHENVSLECRATGNPLPVFTWYKGNVELSNNEHYNITTVNRISDHYVISKLSVIGIEDKDYGDDYLCKATNKIRSAERSFELMKIENFSCNSDQVQQHNASEAGTPVVTSNAVKGNVETTIFSESSTCDSITVFDGKYLRLECYVRGDPEAKIEFAKVSDTDKLATDGLLVYSSLIYYPPPIHRENALILGYARVDYRGLYHCIADNGVGPKIIREINVNVEFEPSEIKAEYWQELHRDVKLECPLKGEYSDHFTWYKGKVQLHRRDRYAIFKHADHTGYYHSSLHVIKLKPEDYGTDYMCKYTDPNNDYSYARIALFEGTPRSSPKHWSLLLESDRTATRVNK